MVTLRPPTLTVLKKDLGRYAWAWISLLVMALLHILVFGTGFGMTEGALSSTLAFLVPLLFTVFPFVLIPLVVQEETLSDPDAYWLTRPIPRLAILGEKILFCIIVVIGIGVIRESVTLVLNGGASRLPHALADVALGFVWLLPLIFLAAQTRSFPRFLLLIILLYVGLILGTLVFFYLISSMKQGFPPLLWGLLPASLDSHWVTLIQHLFWILVMGGILTYYYQRRRLFWAWLLLLPAVAVSAFLKPNRAAFPDVHAAGFAPQMNFQVRLAQKELSKADHIVAMGRSIETYEATLAFPDLPDYRDEQIWIDIMSLEYTVAGKAVNLEETQGLHRAHPAGTGKDGNSLYKVSLLAITSEQREPLHEPGELKVNMRVNITDQVERRQVPLVSGQSFTDDGNRFTLTRITQRNERLNVTILAHIPTYVTERMPKGFGPFAERYSFALLDPDTGLTFTPRVTHNFGITSDQGGTLEFTLPDAFNQERALLIVFRSEIVASSWEFISQSGVTLEQ